MGRWGRAVLGAHRGESRDLFLAESSGRCPQGHWKWRKQERRGTEIPCPTPTHLVTRRSKSALKSKKLIVLPKAGQSGRKGQAGKVSPSPSLWGQGHCNRKVGSRPGLCPSLKRGTTSEPGLRLSAGADKGPRAPTNGFITAGGGQPAGLRGRGHGATSGSTPESGKT